MGDYAVKRIDEMEAIFLGAFKRARAELGVESFGMQVIDMPPNFERYPDPRPHRRRPGGGLRGPARRRRDRDRAASASRSTPTTWRGSAPATAQGLPGAEGIRVLVLGGNPGQAYEAPDVSQARRAGPDGAS